MMKNTGKRKEKILIKKSKKTAGDVAQWSCGFNPHCPQTTLNKSWDLENCCLVKDFSQRCLRKCCCRKGTQRDVCRQATALRVCGGWEICFPYWLGVWQGRAWPLFGEPVESRALTLISQWNLQFGLKRLFFGISYCHCSRPCPLEWKGFLLRLAWDLTEVSMTWPAYAFSPSFFTRSSCEPSTIVVQFISILSRKPLLFFFFFCQKPNQV